MHREITVAAIIQHRHRPSSNLGRGAALAGLIAFSAVARADCDSFLGFLPEGFGVPDGELFGDVRAGYESDDGSVVEVVDDLRQAPGPRVPGFDVTVANQLVDSVATVVGELDRGYATLDIVAVASIGGVPSEAGADARGGAGFNDVITISSPSRNGQAGTVVLGTRVEGALSAASSQAANGFSSEASGTGSAQYQFGVTDGPGVSGVVSPGPDFLACEAVFVEAGAFGTTYPPGESVAVTLGGLVNFEFGAPLAFVFRLEASADARAQVRDPGFPANATVSGDFGNTVTWAGILDVWDQAGNPVTDFTVTSASGTDYTYAITGPAIAPQFTAQPGDASVDAGDAATFSATVAGGGTPITLQWAVSTDGGTTWSDIPGATGSDYTTPATTPADDGRRYRLTATNDIGTTESAVALLSVAAAGGSGGGSSSLDGLCLAALMLLPWLRSRRPAV